MGCSYLHTRAILQISQTNAIKGSETRVLVFSEPFGFIRQLCREWALPGETRVLGVPLLPTSLIITSSPPVTGALGQSGLRQGPPAESRESATRQDTDHGRRCVM